MKVCQSVHLQLQNINYSDAIKRYQDLRTWFLSEFATTTHMEAESAAKFIEDTIASEIQATSLENTPPAEKATKELFDDVANILQKILNGDADAKQYSKALKQKYKTGEKDAQKAAIKSAEALGESLLSTEELKKIIADSLARLQVGDSFSAEDILAQVKGYRTRYLTRSKSKKRARNITKGYYQEALIYKAFSKIITSLDANLSVLDTGPIKVNAKDTAYDIYFNFAKELTKAQFQEIVSEDLDIGYGLQSKSWKIPLQADNDKWSSLKNRHGFSIGTRESLLASAGLKDAYANDSTWLRGVQFLEQQAVIAIGKNQVGYIVPAGFIWTADLITNFRANQYYLAFGVSKDKFTTTVKWTPVEIDAG